MEHFQAALALYRQDGDRGGEAKTLNNLARIHLNQGYHRDALRSYQHALEIFTEIHAEHDVNLAHQNIAYVHYYKGNHDLAISLYLKVLAAYRKAGDLPGELAVLNSIGETLTATEEFAESLGYYQRAEALSLDLGDSYERVIALRGIADAYRGTGEYSRALDYYQKALHLAREISEPRQEGKVLDGLAETMLQAQDPGAARIYWRQARDLFDQLGVPEADTVRLRLAALTAEPAAPTSRLPDTPARPAPQHQQPAPEGQKR
jgi:tetratricopeptide (TPR) repeat protein